MAKGEIAHHGQSSRGAAIRSVLTGVALVSALGGAWTMGGQIGARNAGPSLSDLRIHNAPATFAERSMIPERASFADRFAPVMTQSVAAAPTSSDENHVAALLDPNPSLGAAPSAFRKRLPSALAGWAATPTRIAEAAPRIVPVQPKQQVAALSLPAAPRALVQRAPDPSSGTPHERLVQRATQKLLAGAPASKASIFEKLFGVQPSGPVLAYAGPDTPGLSPSLATSTSAMDRVTAVYDITKRVVYMPDGSKLEAHSGLGNRLDNPEYAHERMRGVTPPHIYDLKPREALFHGVAALRMTPVGGSSAIYGRDGLLAHTYMLGPKGDSNGCISFKDYQAFLRAYHNGEVKRIVVVGKLD